MRSLAIAIWALVVPTPSQEVPVKTPFHSIRYCTMDYFNFPNLSLPCSEVPLVTPRDTPMKSFGEYGPWIDPGQRI